MEVPFESLGPGQKGRLAFQVMGKDGPIYNPSNIRFMMPNVNATQSIMSSELALGVSGLNLAVSSASLVLQSHIAKEIARLHEKLNTLTGIATRTEEMVKTLLQKVQIIDVKVSENNLRHALKHVFERAVDSNFEIDLLRLTSLYGDLETFMQSFDCPFFLNLGLRLSSDVRDQMNGLYLFLFKLRCVVAHHHNAAIRGKPDKTVTVIPRNDYLSAGMPALIDGAIFFHQIDKHLDNTLARVSSEINSRFTWSGPEDQEHFEEILTEKLAMPMMSDFNQLKPLSAAVYRNIPEELFKRSDENMIRQDILRLAEEWLWHTDAGLIWRTQKELQGIKDGYHIAFWEHLKDSTTVPLKVIKVDGFISPSTKKDDDSK